MGWHDGVLVPRDKRGNLELHNLALPQGGARMWKLGKRCGANDTVGSRAALYVSCSAKPDCHTRMCLASLEDTAGGVDPALAVIQCIPRIVRDEAIRDLIKVDVIDNNKVKVSRKGGGVSTCERITNVC
jgi:hypothetical protein